MDINNSNLVDKYPYGEDTKGYDVDDYYEVPTRKSQKRKREPAYWKSNTLIFYKHHFISNHNWT